MALVVPDEGEIQALSYMCNVIVAPERLTLRLYTNDIFPIDTNAFSVYTEALAFGYANVTFEGSQWQVAAGTANTAQQTFTFTGALGNVYGYYIATEVGDTLMWVERFTNGPYDIQNNGDEIRLTPTISAD